MSLVTLKSSAPIDAPLLAHLLQPDVFSIFYILIVTHWVELLGLIGLIELFACSCLSIPINSAFRLHITACDIVYKRIWFTPLTESNVNRFYTRNAFIADFALTAITADLKDFLVQFYLEKRYVYEVVLLLDRRDAVTSNISYLRVWRIYCGLHLHTHSLGEWYNHLGIFGEFAWFAQRTRTRYHLLIKSCKLIIYFD